MPVTSTTYQMLPRSINSSLSLKNRTGNEVAIIYPGAFAGYEALAVELARIIEQQGGDRAQVVADIRIMPTRATPLPQSYRQRSLILLGNLNTNRAFLPLYANYYCATDVTYPGEAGYDLRTVVNPYGTGTNVILAGGSELRGVERAVDRLKSWIQIAAKSSALEVPYLCEVDLAPALAQQLATWPETPLNAMLPNLADGMRKALGFNEGLIRAIGSYTILYAWTSDVRYAEYAHDCLRILNGLMIDSYGDWHYRAERILRALPLLSAGGFLNPDDLRRTDQLLLGTALGIQDMWWRLKSAEPPLGHRHHGRGTFEFYLLARYLRDQARPNHAVRQLCDRWIEECQTFLDALGRTDGTDDQDDESSLNNMATLFWYALGAERFDFFENGHARRVAYRALALHDNAGAGAGQGGYGEALSGAMYFQQEATIPVTVSAFYFHDGALKWILSHLPNLNTPLRYGFLHFAPPFMHKFDTGAELSPQTPAALSGIQRLPITNHQLAIDNHPPEHIEYAGHLVNAPETWLRAEGIAINQLPQAQGFDKLVLRSGFTPADAYLLLQGYQGGYRWQGHNHAANCIVRFGQAGHIFLIQNTSRHSHFHKNGLFIGDGFDTEPLPPFAEWLALDDFPKVGLTATRLSNYHHTDWQRHLFWDKRNGGLWVVLDSIVPKANGPYSCTCTWRTPGLATLEARTWRARQGEHLFTLISSETLAATNETSNAADLQGAANPYILRQFKNGAFTPDDWITFQNLFFVRPFPNTENYDLHRLAPGQALITFQGQPCSWCGVARTPEMELVLEAFVFRAQSAWLSANELVLAGLTYWAAPHISNWVLKSDQPLGLYLDFDAAVAQLRLDSPLTAAAQVEWGFPGQLAVYRLEVGTVHSIPVPNDLIEKLRTALPPAPIASRSAEKSPTRSAVTRPSESGWRTDWKFDPQTRVPERIRAVTIDATPRPIDGFPEQLIDTMLPEMRETWRQWPPAREYRIQIKLDQPTAVDFIRLVGDSYRDPTLRTFYPLPRDLQVTAGVNGQQYACTIDTTPGILKYRRYRDMEDQFETLRAPINRVVQAINLQIAAPPNGRPLVLHEIEIYGQHQVPPAPRHLLSTDLNGDGQSEVLLVNSADELILVSAKGEEIWRQTMPNAVTHLSCHDLDGDGRQWICLGLLGGELRILASNGELRQSLPLAQQFQYRTDAFFGWLNTIHSTEVFYRNERGQAYLVVGGYAILVFIDPLGTIFGHSFGDGPWLTNILCTPPHQTGAGDIWVRCGWNHGIHFYEGRNDAQHSGEVAVFGGISQLMFRALRRLIPFVNGKTVAFEWLDQSKSKSDAILAATEMGFGVLSTQTRDWRWKIESGIPMTACHILTVPGNKPVTEIVLARADGFLAAFDAQDGQPLRRQQLGDPILDMASFSAELPLVLATSRELLALNADWEVKACRPASIQRVLHFNAESVLLLHSDGTLEKLSLLNKSLQ